MFVHFSYNFARRTRYSLVISLDRSKTKKNVYYPYTKPRLDTNDLYAILTVNFSPCNPYDELYFLLRRWSSNLVSPFFLLPLLCLLSFLFFSFSRFSRGRKFVTIHSVAPAGRKYLITQHLKRQVMHKTHSLQKEERSIKYLKKQHTGNRSLEKRKHKSHKHARVVHQSGG